MSVRRLSRNALASMALVIGSTALMIELYRYLLRELGAHQLGVWSLVVATTAAARLGEMGIGNAVMRFMAGDLGARDPSRAAATLGMCLSTVGVSVAALCLLLWPLMSAGLPFLIKDAALLAVARDLLPWALAALWISSIAQIQLSALDALQRTDLKMMLMLAAGAFQLGAAYVLVPDYGLWALGPIQVLHAVISLAATSIVLVRSLDARLSAWAAWSRQRFVALLGYSAGVQAGAVGQLLFEPTVKAFLALSGGPSLTAYYELANRAVTQCRSLIVAAYQMLIPYLSYKTGDQALTSAQTVSTYRLVHSLLFVLSIPFFSLLASALPLILSLWLGRFDASFILIGLACAVGWGLNTLTVSAYMVYMAVGRLRWTLWTQLAIGLLNVLLGGLGAWLWGTAGVVAGAMLALALGSSVVTVAFHREYALSWRDFVPRASGSVIGVSLLGAGVLAALQLSRGDPVHDASTVVPAVAALALVCAALAWRHPAVAGIVQRLRAQEAA